MQPTEQVSATHDGHVSNALSADERFDRDFKPNGAIAFFVLLILLGLVIWYGIYFLMLERM